VLLYLPYRQNEVDETLGACGVRFRDPVLGPGSGQRPMRATSPRLFVKISCVIEYNFVEI
jgi:hypothetical protein